MNGRKRTTKRKPVVNIDDDKLLADKEGTGSSWEKETSGGLSTNPTKAGLELEIKCIAKRGGLKYSKDVDFKPGEQKKVSVNIGQILLTEFYLWFDGVCETGKKIKSAALEAVKKANEKK